MQSNEEIKDVTLEMGRKVEQWLTQEDREAKFCLIIFKHTPNGLVQSLTGSAMPPQLLGSLLTDIGSDLVNPGPDITIEFPPVGDKHDH